jgi:hypothetical protein
MSVGRRLPGVGDGEKCNIHAKKALIDRYDKPHLAACVKPSRGTAF